MNSHSRDSLSTSLSLLVRAERGDANAWQRIVQVYGPLVYTWARKSGLREDDAADMVQETMLAVMDGLNRFDAAREDASFRGWLRRIARNKCVDFVRQEVKLNAGAKGGSTNLAACNALQLEHYTETDEDTLAVEQNGVVRRALAIMRNHFEKTTWKAFWRTAIDGCSPDDVAQELGMSRWNVYKARSRVLQRLRSELSGLEDLP